ncbi:MAG: UbiA family prenyltransferase [Candidatus Thorarchaeota archaeon]
MIRKTLLFRNLTDNIPKNVGLYSVGILFLVISGYSFELINMGFGLIAFIISYSSVYVFNDIFDISEDEGLPAKRTRKPLVQGSVEKSEAIIICLVLLIVGLSLSLLQNSIFFGILSFLIIINALYSIPIVTLSRSRLTPHETDQQDNTHDITRPISFKHTIAGLPLVFVMQFLKILLPWTITPELVHFPFLFAVGFSLTYVVLFKGYKMDRTVGESVTHEPLLFSAAVIVFILSMLVHPEPILQASIFFYLLAGVIFFRKHHLVDKTVIILSPVYIIVGVLILFWMILYI